MPGSPSVLGMKVPEPSQLLSNGRIQVWKSGIVIVQSAPQPGTGARLLFSRPEKATVRSARSRKSKLLRGVREAHARKLEFHAWFNPYRVLMDTNRDALVPTHPARVHWVEGSKVQVSSP